MPRIREEFLEDASLVECQYLVLFRLDALRGEGLFPVDMFEYRPCQIDILEVFARSGLIVLTNLLPHLFVSDLLAIVDERVLIHRWYRLGRNGALTDSRFSVRPIEAVPHDGVAGREFLVVPDILSE